MLPQFRRTHEFDYARIVSGLRLMAWGLFKKVVVADRLALLVNPVFNNPRQHPEGPLLVLATLAFTFQIYGDFSGYTDLARGAARVLGFDFNLNFRQPYQSASVPEFWRRWHISLSSWFRDYLYIPLGGSRVGPARAYWKPAGRVPHQRALARGQLHVSGVGRPARRVSGAQHLGAAGARVAGAAHGAGGAPPVCGAALGVLHHVRAGGLRLDISSAPIRWLMPCSSAATCSAAGRTCTGTAGGHAAPRFLAALPPRAGRGCPWGGPDAAG